MNQLKFTKMHGLGNDFIVIDAVNQTVSLNPKLIQQLADRHFGIGFDQCLLIEESQAKDIDFFYRIYNANGNEVGQCGNGARCLAQFIHEKGLSNKKKLILATKTTTLALTINSDSTVTVDMGKPELQDDLYTIEIGGQDINMHLLSIGNPHAIITVPDVDTAPVQQFGKQLSTHSRFPDGVNVSFMQKISEKEIKLRVYERDVGETLACGSAACAAVVAGRLYAELNEEVLVHLPGGSLKIMWKKAQSSVTMTGTAQTVFEGLIDFDMYRMDPG